MVAVSLKKKNKKQEITPIKISAINVSREYGENEIKADTKYKNKWLEVDGTVKSIQKDFMDDMFITIKGNDFLNSVHCTLEESELNKAINLTEGARITVLGKNRGSTMGSVMLKQCIIK